MALPAALVRFSSSVNSGGAAGEEGVDQRRGDDAESMQALLFLERLVVSGLLGRQVGVALLESGEEDGVFFTEAGVFGLKSGVFLAPRLGFIPPRPALFVSPV